MRKKLFWLVAFSVDVVVFMACGTAVALHFLVTHTLYYLFWSIVFILTFEPGEAFSLMKWWGGAAVKYIAAVKRILHEKLAKSFKEPILLKKVEDEEESSIEQ